MPHVHVPGVRVGRAAPLPPDERRTAILRAVQDVILERGTGVTTRDLAEAAGVAEGTLFRVFEDKTTLLRAAVLAAVDPAVALEPLADVDLQAPLAERVSAVLRIGQARVERTVAWMSLLHQLGRPERAAGTHGHRGMPGWEERRRETGLRVRAQIARILAPDADRLRVGLDEATTLLEVILVGSAVRSVEAARAGTSFDGLDPEAVATMFLSGVLEPGAPSDPDLEGSSTC